MAETMIKYEPDSNRPEMSSTPKREESDPRNSLLHVLAAAPSPITSKPGQGDMTEDEEENGSIRKASPTNGSVNETRRPQAPSTSSIFSGNKIKHLKKEDGIPLWRKDIQFEFLRHVFENRKPVFSNSYEEKTGYSFADVYIYAMAVSSKTSKILRDKLLSDRRAAVHMAMVCLLVNVGRMNTTLNCKIHPLI
jgi:Ino eighty subunit 1